MEKHDDFKIKFENLLKYGLLPKLPTKFPYVGLLDVNGNIDPLDTDSKILSKLLEDCVKPKILEFLKDNNFITEKAKEQNYYPDHTIIDATNNIKFALDIKSSYIKKPNTINGLTLGSYTGYFRNRTGKKNINYPYNEYLAHYVLGILYNRNNEIVSSKKQIYSYDEKEYVPGPIKGELIYFMQEKYKIASEVAGSSNTKNIGSIKDIEKLKKGAGPFSQRGEKEFDKYWMNYDKTKNK